MVCTMEDDFVTKVFLELAKETCCKMWLLFEVGDMMAPLVLKERFNVLVKGWRKTLGAKPSAKGSLKGEDVASLGGIKSAVHIGIEKDSQVRWELKVAQGKNVVAVGSGAGGIQ